jgi:hypothetical protein
MRLLFLSHSAETGVFRVGSHHLARELGAAGHDVAHVSTPITLGHLARLADDDVRARLAMARTPRRRGPVRHLVAAAPAPLRFGGPSRRLAAAHVRRMLGAGWLDGVDVAIVDQALFEPIIGLLAPRARIIYRPTDTHDPASAIGRAEAALVQRADGVVATSPPVLASLGPRAESVPSLLLENGVELARFRAAAVGGAERTHEVVYVGALDHRFDWRTVAQIAEALPAVRIDLIGPPPAEVPVELRSGVRLLGPVPYDELPATLRRYRVGLLPFNAAPVNAGRSPMKYFEYLAAGLHIVARSTEALERLAAPGTATFRDGGEAARLVEQALAASPNVRGAAHAERYDWGARAGQLAAFAEQLR